MNSERRHVEPHERIAALKRHLLEGVPVSTICDELGIAPTAFYRWQKELFENGHTLFETVAPPRPPTTPRMPRSSSSKPSSRRKTRSWPSSWKLSPRKKKEMGRPDQALGPA